MPTKPIKVNVKSFTDAIMASDRPGAGTPRQRMAMAREITDRALELYHDIVIENWTGGEEYRRQEAEVARRTNNAYLLKRAQSRETWPNLDFDTEYKELPSEVLVRVHTDNPLFNWLDRGTQGSTAGSKGNIYVGIRTHATLPDMLRMYPRPVVNSTPTHVKAGQKIGGIEPRNWSKLIAAQLEREFAETPFKIKVTVL